MFPSSTVLPKIRTQRAKPLTVIKIKSPKSDIKLHNLNVSKNSKPASELASKGYTSNVHNDEVDKITLSWDNLKVTALSKAIAMAPDVGSCTIGPKSSSIECDIECDKPDLSKAITSTPLKPPLYSRNRIMNDEVDSFNLTQTKQLFNSNLSNNEQSQLETLRIMCLTKIEAYINNHVQRKREHILKAWQEHDEKMKEKSLALKLEFDNERILRIQEQNTAIQKVIMETEANNQVKAEQQQQIKFNHEKRIAERGEKLRQIEQKRKEMEEKRKKLAELKQCIDGIYEMHVAYNKKYCQIHEINKSCSDVRLLSEKVSGEVPKLKAMNELMLQIVEKSNEGKVSLLDLMTAEALVQQITIISEIFAQCVDEVNKSFEKAEQEKKKEQLAKDSQRKQEEAVQQENIKIESQRIETEKSRKPQTPEKLSFSVDDCISNECLSWHLELRQFLEDYEKKLEPLVSNDSLKKFRFECQKAVNVPVNTISPVDDLHLEDKLYKLSRLLEGKATPLGNSLFLATGHPLGVSFCTNLLAKKFVKQGELTVSSKPEAAFAIAAVIVALWVDFPEFGRLLLAHFHRECPYLIPAFLPQVEGQSNEVYYKMLGYQYSEDGKVEAQDKFLRRMSGVMHLYAAILVTLPRRAQVAEGKKSPLHMKEAWRWLTSTLNLSPRPDISPTLLFDFLEVAGGMMFNTYRVQFTKLIQFLCTDYFPKIEQVTPDGCGGPVTRLKSILQRILKEGQLPPPPGLLPPNFW